MPPIRSLQQPGPPHPIRIDCFRDTPVPLRFRLEPGQTLAQAITAPLAAAGFQSATLSFRGAGLSPFAYVMPGPPDGPDHAAYFSAPSAPQGLTRIEQANATFGFSDGKPMIHCHAAWTEPDGRRRGGHILPGESIITEPADVQAWGFRNIRIETAPDAETNFTLFQPTGPGAAGPAVVARVKPNEDILTALETIAHTQGMRDATVRGSLGSLVGARFTDGGAVEDYATEVLVRAGHIRDGVAALDLLVVDMRGEVREGWLRRGDNPVCITFDLVLEAA